MKVIWNIRWEFIYTGSEIKHSLSDLFVEDLFMPDPVLGSPPHPPQHEHLIYDKIVQPQPLKTANNLKKEFQWWWM